MRQTTRLWFVIVALCATASVTAGQSETTESQRKCVAVTGAVHAPGRFELKRPTRLLEVLAFAGGFTERAGQTIQVVSVGATCSKEAFEVKAAESTASIDLRKGPTEPTSGIRFYRIADINTDDEARNPYLDAGALIVVSESESAFVIGWVVQPREIVMKDPVTVTRAIVLAGGFTRDAQTKKVWIHRQPTSSGPRQDLLIDLDKIRKKRAEDVILQPNDIVEVQSKSGRVMYGDFGQVRSPTYDPHVRVIY